VKNKKINEEIEEETLDEESYGRIKWQVYGPEFKRIDEARQIVLWILAIPSDEELPIVLAEIAEKLEAELDTNSPNLLVCKLWLTVFRAYRRSIIRDNSIVLPCRKTLVELLEQEFPLHFHQKSLFIDSVLREIDHDNEPF